MLVIRPSASVDGGACQRMAASGVLLRGTADPSR
jgi:hypothetical protein